MSFREIVSDAKSANKPGEFFIDEDIPKVDTHQSYYSSKLSKGSVSKFGNKSFSIDIF
jgi:hypothetical protein